MAQSVVLNNGGLPAGVQFVEGAVRDFERLAWAAEGCECDIHLAALDTALWVRSGRSNRRARDSTHWFGGGFIGSRNPQLKTPETAGHFAAKPLHS